MKKIIVILSLALSLTLSAGHKAGAEEAPAEPLNASGTSEETAPPPPALSAAPEPGRQIPRPGQEADPAKRPPDTTTPLDVRRQRTDGPWLGVTERELADGHPVEVHVSGSAEVVGQEVISRPNGRRVNRYYSGRPDAPRPSGSDPVQDERNREDLRIIYSPGDK